MEKEGFPPWNVRTSKERCRNWFILGSKLMFLNIDFTFHFEIAHYCTGFLALMETASFYKVIFITL
jgi:hypothetical protein